MNENRYHSTPVSHTAQSSRTRNPWQHAAWGPSACSSIATRNPWHPETSGSTPPPNFACNSPTPLSNFESTSLKFRGFLDIANWSDDRIACEIVSERPHLSPYVGPSTSQIPKLRTHTPPIAATITSAGRDYAHHWLTNAYEPTSNFQKFRDLRVSTADTTDEL